jgi:hypothetical protein
MPIELEDRGKALEDQYFHKKEQELIANMKRKLAADSTKETEMECPRCNGTLKETDFEGVTIDVCDSCQGVWLDAGELAQLNEKERHERGWFHRLLG